MEPVEVVSATRLSEEEFWGASALGQSLRRLGYDNRISTSVYFENSRGLPEIYNERIQAKSGPDVLVFVHDDVWLDDYFFVDRVLHGLRGAHVLGVAGNMRRVPFQPAWAFVNTAFAWDEKKYLSGSVAHGQAPFGGVSPFGPAPAPCELLDGVFLAARKSVLMTTKVFFDPRFRFHFYDMDFCRTARKSGLKLTTWPICLTHQSGGAFGTPAWQEMYRAYLEKWTS